MAEPVESSLTLPGVPSMAAVAVEHVAYVLEGSPRCGDALRIAGDLVRTALDRAAEFRISVCLWDSRVRISVSRRGVDLLPGPALTDTAGVADDMGHDRDLPTDTVTVWAEISWPRTLSGET